MFRTLDPVTESELLRRALRKRKAKIYLCECGYAWISPKKPLKCANCRALADSPKRNRPGRPLVVTDEDDQE